ncbi:50S ribosomal protein L5 [Candidatus Vidania fulgoroideae]|uniref:50S ribosomal protein L5 n=1 Tax=Candidatus Vidania fulgoroideorum TaxID=881286 RepID=A0A974X7F0_9PROT|nr:50S ribosomal protein L5 [Candidatus Vidania fulgoroideae]
MNTFKNLCKERIYNKFRHKYSNIMMHPRLIKLVINSSLGSRGNNSSYLKGFYKEIYEISCQKPLIIKSKSSISNFNIRKGIPNGIKVTLRNNLMFNFISKFINISIPRIVDFRGFSNRSIDYNGSFNFGYSDHSIFPEIFLSNNKTTPKGFNINIIISSIERIDSLIMLKTIGFPFA